MNLTDLFTSALRIFYETSRLSRQSLMRLLDGMPYVPAVLTDIRTTFERFGFRPTTDAERKARQKRINGEITTKEKVNVQNHD